jgi:hypothetical protein
MTFDDPGDGIFDHLDDPAPPVLGGDALTHVMQRGHQIRRRRRSIYSVSTAVVVIAVAGIAIGVTRPGATSGGNESVTPLKSPTSSSLHPTPSTKKRGSHAPNGVTQTTYPGQPPHHSGGGGSIAPVPPVCVTTTPTVAPTSIPPTSSPTTSPSGAPTPAPTATPVVTCVTPTPTPTATPSGSASGTPTDGATPDSIAPTP